MHGWCRPDGRIGLDSITQRYPTAKEIIEDGINLLTAFPFLNMVFFIWQMEEEYGFDPTDIDFWGMPQVQFGIRFHGNCIELYPPQDAWDLFCQYQKSGAMTPSII